MGETEQPTLSGTGGSTEEQTRTRAADDRGLTTAVLHRKIGKCPFTAAAGHGAFIFRPDGSSMLDLSAGAGVTCLGYHNQAITGAMRQQLEMLPYVHAQNWTTEPVERLAHELLYLIGDHRFAKGAVLFLNGGAEAIEAACKIAIQYYMAQGVANPTFWGRGRAYHGNSFWTMGLGDSPRKEPYRLFCKYTDRFDKPWDIRQNGRPVVVLEPIAGTAAHIQLPEPGELNAYASRVHGPGVDGLLIYDEILCGNYRTGHLFAYQALETEAVPDMIVCGKGITGGYFPLSAVIINNRVREALEGIGYLWHSTTNQNHPLGAAAGVAALHEYQMCLPRIDELCLMMTDQMPRFKDCPIVEDVRGIGTLWGITLRKPIPDLQERSSWAGLALYHSPNFIMVAPPYCIPDGLLESGLALLRELLTELE